MISMGSSALLVAFLVSLYGTGISLGGSITGRKSFVRSAEIAATVNFLLITVSSIVLMNAFLTRDFSLLYVYEYSSRSLSNGYAVTAFWAGQEGSLLLWAWLLAFSMVLVVRQNRRSAPVLTTWAVFVLMVNASFFLALLNFVSNPFAPFPAPVPADGYGLNPLLQDPGMIIHPPMLLAGYVGLTVPFAFAMASLLAGRKDSLWIIRTRHWTVISWFLLGAGILLGAKWAYVELGWGGYWAWDPVENASLMPWLTLTAFLHSAMVQERRGMFKLWNVNLMMATFFLVVLGTFITRSGVVSSVHAFGESRVGNFFLIYMGFILAACLVALLVRRNLLVPEDRLHAPLERESFFFLNNIVLSVMAFSILWGTLFPVFTELLTGVKVTVGPSFYNRVNLPMVILLMTLLGICPLLAREKTHYRDLAVSLALPLILAAAAAAGSVGAGIDSLSTILVFSLSAFITGSVLVEVYRDFKANTETTENRYVKTRYKIFQRNRRRYGGYIVHMGMILILLGLSGAPLTTETLGTIKPGESLGVGDYRLEYRRMVPVPEKDRLAVTARLLAFRREEPLGWLVPERRFYAKWEDQPTSEVSILSGWKEDLYVAMTGYDRDGRASFRVLVNPFVPWLWSGGYIAGIGTLIVVWPRRRKVDMSFNNVAVR